MTDEEAIRKTVAEFCQLQDDRRFDEFLDIWVEEATFRFLGLVHKGRDNIREYLEQFPARRGVHGGFNPVIETAGDSAQAGADYIWFDVIDGDLQVNSGGRFNFRLVRNPDRWRIAELEVRLLLSDEEITRRSQRAGAGSGRGA